ncbi:hypothetical protein R69658_08260 [Paraburkholderia aspalathi]|uniref:Transposase Tn5 dimerisation domain-containing protein n=1 Tax=Paraburkholderia aspalathi TaxID=1324617 RepID=A0ABN7NHH8_9BURK|nr:hypothetical protein R69658_08260 [Paraburkholderia aspalathi]
MSETDGADARSKWIAHLEAAQREGLTLAAYSRAHGIVFEPDEWRAAFILNRKAPPSAAPRLNEVVRLVAMLGGFLARKGDGEPGVKTIWQGLQRVMDFAAGIRYAREIGHEWLVCNGMP